MKPHIVNNGDGSTHFEWVGEKYRFWITIEKNIEGSFWGIVSKGLGIFDSGYISPEFFGAISEHIRDDLWKAILESHRRYANEEHEASDPTSAPSEAETEAQT